MYTVIVFNMPLCTNSSFGTFSDAFRNAHLTRKMLYFGSPQQLLQCFKRLPLQSLLHFQEEICVRLQIHLSSTPEKSLGKWNVCIPLDSHLPEGVIMSLGALLKSERDCYTCFIIFVIPKTTLQPCLPKPTPILLCSLPLDLEAIYILRERKGRRDRYINIYLDR